MGVPHSASPGNESPKACDSWRAGAGIILGQAANPTEPHLGQQPDLLSHDIEVRAQGLQAW